MTETGVTSAPVEEEEVEEDGGQLIYPFVKWMGRSRSFWVFKEGSVALWGSLVLMILDTALICSGIGMTEWAKAVSSHEAEEAVTRYQGLWRLCHSQTGCRTFKPDSITGEYMIHEVQTKSAVKQDENFTV
jgi:hypothetical protein